MAQRTGLEPATPGVTGRYSNQLNYHCTVADDDDPNLSNWWVVTDSNRRHSACKADALPTELTTVRYVFRKTKFLVTKWSRFGHKRLVTLVLLKY